MSYVQDCRQEKSRRENRRIKSKNKKALSRNPSTVGDEGAFFICNPDLRKVLLKRRLITNGKIIQIQKEERF